MSIDKADWHWDDTEKLYRKTNNVKGELTEEQQEEIWLLASNHIGLFLRWLIDRGFNELIGRGLAMLICSMLAGLILLMIKSIEP